MYGIFTYIYHKNQPNVGKYTIHGSYGIGSWCWMTGVQSEALWHSWRVQSHGEAYGKNRFTELKPLQKFQKKSEKAMHYTFKQTSTNIPKESVSTQNTPSSLRKTWVLWAAKEPEKTWVTLCTWHWDSGTPLIQNSPIHKMNFFITNLHPMALFQGHMFHLLMRLALFAVMLSLFWCDQLPI